MHLLFRYFLIQIVSITSVKGYSQNILKADTNSVIIKRSDRKEAINWSLDPRTKPDVYNLSLPEKKSIHVTYVGKSDSISFTVNHQSHIRFTILNANGDTCLQELSARLLVPKASFSEAFKKSKKGKVDIQVPEVYELLSIVIALTPTANTSTGMVSKNTPYYEAVKKYFAPFETDTFVKGVNTFIKNGEYILRTNAYAFSFTKEGKIIRSGTYDRIMYMEEEPNHLLPFIEGLQEFSDKTRFRSFYKEWQPYYEKQIAFFRDSVQYAKMIRWLEGEFPSVRYQYHNIVFSPLTGFNQGMMWFENNSFNELQVHINFPYTVPATLTISDSSKIVFRGNILFTELNHGYVNKVADQYMTEINEALNPSKRALLINPKMGAGYYRAPGETFKEYMNWALVAIRHLNFAKPEDIPALLEYNKAYMDRRGFTQFAQFQDYFVDIYKNRKQGQTIADLYPSLIGWFQKI